ncbi:hypothetical protein QMK28_25895, partial [Streptomyces sp. H27-D2]|nr:hypothetical protein [Streptomyces sp. H27-D2]
LPGHGGAEPLPAHQLLGLARKLRRQVLWRDPAAGSAPRTSLVAGVRVSPPGRHAWAGRGQGCGDLLLLGVGADARRWPSEVWLTDMTDADPAALLRLTALLNRVDRDSERIADRVGIRDFAGRSFNGWHRHMTLASAAHAVAALSGPAGAQPAARQQWTGQRPVRHSA